MALRNFITALLKSFSNNLILIFTLSTGKITPHLSPQEGNGLRLTFVLTLYLNAYIWHFIYLQLHSLQHQWNSVQRESCTAFFLQQGGRRTKCPQQPCCMQSLWTCFTACPFQCWLSDRSTPEQRY